MHQTFQARLLILQVGKSQELRGQEKYKIIQQITEKPAGYRHCYLNSSTPQQNLLTLHTAKVLFSAPSPPAFQGEGLATAS